MTLRREDHAREIFSALADRGAEMRHLVLHADTAELTRRIDSDSIEARARRWRHDRRASWAEALGWLRASAEITDTTERTPDEVARHEADLLASPAGPQRCA